MTDDHGATQGAWFELVRRARLDNELKLAALTVGSYADADGTHVYPGTARLAADLDVSYRTAQRRLAGLREIGLLERTKRVREPGKSDEYRLVHEPRLVDHVVIPNPGEYVHRIAEIRAQER